MCLLRSLSLASYTSRKYVSLRPTDDVLKLLSSGKGLGMLGGILSLTTNSLNKMTNNKARKEKPAFRAMIGAPVTSHLLRDMTREKLDQHRKTHLTTKHLKISEKK